MPSCCTVRSMPSLRPSRRWPDGTEGSDCCTIRCLRREAIRFGQQQVAEGLKADAAGVDAADDSVDGSPFPDGGGIHARARSQLLSPRPEVIAEVRVAAHDGAEIARRFGSQPGWIDELVAAVTRLQGVHLVDITVNENRGPIVVGKATAIHAIQRVRHSGPRTRSPP